jgi:NAD(P)H-hydrate epimerase
MFEPLYTADEMRQAESGHDVDALMQRAGRAVAEEALRRFPEAASFGAACGTGANGGDARIALGVLREAGKEAAETLDADVLLDGLLGTGFHGELRADVGALVERMNASGRPIVAVDLPTGVDADTGEVAGVAVQATVTVAMHGAKVGNVVAPGRFHGGDLVVADIGLDHGATAMRRVTPAVLDVVPRRQAGGTKYRSGSVLVVGGAPGMTGAATLAAEAAFRADAGYVIVAVPSESLPVLEPGIVEAVKRPLEDVFDAAAKAGALALGPGLGREPERAALVRRLLAETELPAVVDADALFGLEPCERSAPTVLTPHAGELGRLLGTDADWVDAHRLEAVTRAAERFGCVCLLKGADTIVAAPGEGTLVSDLGPPSLATAGTGDVLTGVIGAILAKGVEPRLAAAAGAMLCALAARMGPRRGLVARDVVALLPQAFDAR